MPARMKNPAMILPDAMNGIQHLLKAMSQGGVLETTLELVHLRASQINGCRACMIATTNLFNRLNATIKQPAGATWGS